jgi:ubiquinone/menaquinone biosynthesis C-methylase UbiE
MQGFVDPQMILKELRIKEDMVMAEFGCGSGKLTLALAERLKKGRVYGLDIQEEPLLALRSMAKLRVLPNIEIIRCDLEQRNGSTLTSNSLDAVLIPNLLFQSEDPKVIIAEGERVLKPGGELLIIDWKIDSPLGPKQKVSAEEIKKMTNGLNLELKKEFNAGDYHYGLLFTKEIKDKEK